MSRHTKMPVQVYRRGEECGPYILAVVFDTEAYKSDLRPDMTVACGKPNPKAGLYWPAEGMGGIAPETQEANANLIAEAFNVTNDTGFTPRQLAEQRAELLEACKLINAQLPSDTLKSNPAIQAVRAAIAKAEGGAP